MKKKNLPDHRIKYSSNLIEFEDDFVANLVADFGFRNQYLLTEKLDSLALFNEKPEYFANVPKAEQKILWKEIEDSSFNLKSAIANLGPDEFITLGIVIVQRGHQGQIVESFNRNDWIRRLDVISDVAKMAGELVEQKVKRGRPPEEEKQNFVMSLVKIYQEGTGRDDRPWRNDEEIYQGRLIKFCERVIKYMSLPIEISNRYIGDTIKNTLPPKSRD